MMIYLSKDGRRMLIPHGSKFSVVETSECGYNIYSGDVLKVDPGALRSLEIADNGIVMRLIEELDRYGLLPQSDAVNHVALGAEFDEIGGRVHRMAEEIFRRYAAAAQVQNS